jgi:hypothetical protein
MTTERSGRAKLMPSDIDTYAQYVGNMDPTRYFDSQAQQVRSAALKRWPLLAVLLKPESKQPPQA